MKKWPAWLLLYCYLIGARNNISHHKFHSIKPSKIQVHEARLPNSLGKLQDPRNWSKQFKRLAKAAGVNVTFHKLRHDHASRLSANGVSIKDAQYRLGHNAA